MSYHASHFAEPPQTPLFEERRHRAPNVFVFLCYSDSMKTDHLALCNVFSTSWLPLWSGAHYRHSIVSHKYSYECSSRLLVHHMCHELWNRGDDMRWDFAIAEVHEEEKHIVSGLYSTLKHHFLVCLHFAKSVRLAQWKGVKKKMGVKQSRASNAPLYTGNEAGRKYALPFESCNSLEFILLSFSWVLFCVLRGNQGQPWCLPRW